MEEEEDLFVFNDIIEGPRAPAVKPGRIARRPPGLFRTHMGSEWAGTTNRSPSTTSSISRILHPFWHLVDDNPVIDGVVRKDVGSWRGHEIAPRQTVVRRSRHIEGETVGGLGKERAGRGTSNGR